MSAMNMPFMPFDPSVGVSGSSGAAAGAAVPNLLPESLGVIAAAAFLGIACSHVRHMVNTDGQRRPWHACHVLIALGMVFMYLPAALDPLGVPLGFWRVVFACAGLVAALWAVAGNARVPVLMWTLTAFDLGAMLYMWSVPDQPGTAGVSWILIVYLVASACMWLLDAYRRIDGGVPIVSWQAMAAGGELVAAQTLGRFGATRSDRRPSPRGAGVTRSGGGQRATASEPLLGELDIGISMIVMAVGMAYMVLATQLMS